jgi:hypothetical protein
MTQARSAPLQVTVEIELESGDAAGERRFRLSRQVLLPPALRFDLGLPLEGEGRGFVCLRLPGGEAIATRALLRFDPEKPERGSEAELVGLEPEALLALERYIEERTRS